MVLGKKNLRNQTTFDGKQKIDTSANPPYHLILLLSNILPAGWAQTCQLIYTTLQLRWQSTCLWTLNH